MSHSLLRELFRRLRLRRNRNRTHRIIMRRAFFESLEDRSLLATFAESGSTLNLTLNTANEAVAIVANSNNTVTMTDTGGTWSGTNSANVSGNGTTTLTISAAGETN